jgi:hypothetical protein
MLSNALKSGRKRFFFDDYTHPEQHTEKQAEGAEQLRQEWGASGQKNVGLVFFLGKKHI